MFVCSTSLGSANGKLTVRKSIWMKFVFLKSVKAENVIRGIQGSANILVKEDFASMEAAVGLTIDLLST